MVVPRQSSDRMGLNTIHESDKIHLLTVESDHLESDYDKFEEEIVDKFSIRACGLS
ncbi:hypothetical protein KIN20_005978 [Parelaphostrongylus tenuis]|uniref:Uncharacterized protein n=1 Tax=Parelaphostrongylus tenuis TaxID=148309 RepID=A0AAD5MLX2_PARTN|nr:hypothetical protein KIN20_005978 [Parelaphostrongylus tenuis]